MKRPGFFLLVGIPWLVTLVALSIHLTLPHTTDAAHAWTWVALVSTILTGVLPGILRWINQSKRNWLHIVVGDVSLVATAVATALASDDGRVTMWIAICANALSAVGSHLVFVFWDDTDRIPRLDIPRLEPNPRPENIGSKTILNKNNELEVVYFYPDGTPYTAPTAAPKTNRILYLRGVLLIALILFWVILLFVDGSHWGAAVYIIATLIYALIVQGIYFKDLDPTRPVWRALKVTSLGVGILASSHSVGELGLVDDHEARVALDWTSFVVIQLLAVLAHATT